MVSDRVLRTLIRSDRLVALTGDLVRVGIGIMVISIIWLYLMYYAAVGRFMFTDLNMNDFGKFYYSAQLFLEGRDMYGVTPATAIKVADNDVRQFWNLNPPHFHLLLLPFALLTPSRALIAWGVLSLLGFGVSLAVVMRELQVRLTVASLVWGVLACLALSATGALVVTGQLTFIILPIATLAWRGLRRGQWTSAACWLGLLISIKPLFATLGVAFLIQRQWRAGLTMAASAAVPFAAGLVIFGWQAHLDWVGALGSASWAWPPMNGSIAGVSARLFSETPIFTPIAVSPVLQSLLTTSGSALIVIVSYRTLRVIAGRRESAVPARMDQTVALLALSSLLLTPLGWVYYLWLLAPPLAGLWRQLKPGRGNAAGWWMLVSIPGALCPLFVTGLGREHFWFSGTIGSIYFWLTLALWLAVVSTARPHAHRFDSSHV